MPCGVFHPPGVIVSTLFSVRNADRRANSIDALLRATLDSLVEVGYARFRVADVAPRCGLSQGLLFRYFPTKQDLMRACLERALEENLERVKTAFTALDFSSITRRQLLETLWEINTHPQSRWMYEFYAASSYDPDLGSRLRPIFDANTANVNELVRAFVPQNVLPTATMFEAFELVNWAMQGLAINCMAAGWDDRHHSLIDYLLFLAEKTYGPE
jgi:AcrR family transcriptional regulator